MNRRLLEVSKKEWDVKVLHARFSRKFENNLKTRLIPPIGKHSNYSLNMIDNQFKRILTWQKLKKRRLHPKKQGLNETN